MSVIEKAFAVLQRIEFVAMATSGKNGKPNSSSKLLLKIEGSTVYFIDYSIGRTAENLQVNPEVSLSFIDINSLLGFRLNGKVKIIGKGKTFDECRKDLQKKEIKLSAERIIRGIHEGKSYKEFELAIPERFLVYKVKVEEGCEISPRGEIKREDSSVIHG
ncbi:MAG: pyridoxamine 5'-phosphate oxidase family protein [Candidatus Omnitrophica bacterium]|nr:pyridoxamine 5'-phosphate oxidase family protein [Candidatus Omnitrophota bacterium]